MITLNASGGSITFEFSGNSTYLNDGQITVPVNSLALIIDESDMATFRKAASNDIFVSANIAEFGMTKDELISWYETNMVGSTGGGGGVTSGEVQTMIDESISGKTNQSDFTAYTASTDAALSGKANSNDVYTTGQTSGATEIANALNAKLDATAYTPIEVSSAITSGSTNAVESKAIWSATTYNKEITLQWDNGFPSKLSTNYPSGCKKFVVTVPSNNTAVIMLYNGGSSIAGSITISNYSSPSVSIVGYDSTTYTISGNDVTFVVPDTITFDQLNTNTRSITSIKAIVEGAWIADNTYMKEEVDTIASGLQTNINSKLDATAYTPVTIDSTLNVASTNPVQNQALYSELRIGGGEIETTLVIENNHSTNYPSGCTKLKVEVVGSNNFTTINFVDNDAQNLGAINIFNWGGISVDTSYFQSATYEISGTTVIISYPTVQNVTEINVNNGSYIYKAVTTEPPIPLKDVISGKVDTDTYSAYTADTTPKVDAAWQEGVKAPSLAYDTISGITLSSLPISGSSYNYSSIATDDSLKSDNESVLGVYATGDTYVVSINPTERNNTAYLGADKKPFNIKMYWNSSYTGNTSHYIAVSCLVNDGTNGYCQWNWENNQYVPNDKYINTAVTLSYDSTNQVVTITPSSSSALDYIKYVKSNRYIAPSSSLTQEDCRIGLVTIDSNLYKLQEALDNKQDTLSAGTGISIVDNVISATSGGGSLNISISGGSGNFSIQENGGAALGDFSHAEGHNTMTTPNGDGAHAEGNSTVAGGEASHTEGVHTTTNNLAEHASGRYNKSSISSATFGDSGNTLFTVGNGTSSADTHNAFEIRQNGDIYFEYDGNDIKLQDKLDEVETVTAAALINLNNRFGGLSIVKLTESEYTALVTKDPNVLYVVIPDPLNP